MCSACAAEPVPRTAARTLPGMGTLLLAFLPKFGCPLCWPALAATLGLFGLHVESLTPILLALTASTLFLAIALWLRATRAKKDRLPYLLLGISSVAALAVRLALLPPIVAGGVAVLIAIFLVVYQIHSRAHHLPSGQR